MRLPREWLLAVAIMTSALGVSCGGGDDDGNAEELPCCCDTHEELDRYQELPPSLCEREDAIVGNCLDSTATQCG